MFVNTALLFVHHNKLNLSFLLIYYCPIFCCESLVESAFLFWIEVNIAISFSCDPKAIGYPNHLLKVIYALELFIVVIKRNINQLETDCFSQNIFYMFIGALVLS